jgi:hypothetical protein
VSAPSGHSWGHYLFSIALTVALFTVVGPFLGAFVFMLPSLFHSMSFPFEMLAPLTRSALVLGGLPAAITGLIVALVSPFIRRDWILYLFAAVIGAAICVLTFVSVGLIVMAGPNVDDIDVSILDPFLIMLAGIAALVAPICTLFARPLGLRPAQAATASPESP